MSATFAVGKPSSRPAPVALDHHAADLVGTTEQLGRAGDVAGGEPVADPGGRVRLVDRIRLRRDEPEPDDLESEVGTHALEQRDVAAAAVTEVEVGADHHEPRAEQPDEHLVDEVLGRLLAAALVELAARRRRRAVPAPTSSSSLWSSVVSSAGAVSGRTTCAGCRSKVTHTASRPRASASSRTSWSTLR